MSNEVEQAIANVNAHIVDRKRVESILKELEALMPIVDQLFIDLEPAAIKCIQSHPSSLELNHYQRSVNSPEDLSPLRLRLRIPLILDVLRYRGNRGMNSVLAAADKRF